MNPESKKLAEMIKGYITWGHIVYRDSLAEAIDSAIEAKVREMLPEHKPKHKNKVEPRKLYSPKRPRFHKRRTGELP